MLLPISYTKTYRKWNCKIIQFKSNLVVISISPMDILYRQAMKYGVAYSRSAEYLDCPTRHYVCCAQHLLVAGQCIRKYTKTSD